ncbi:MAG: hypothetical protein WDN50_18190 [Bradyrhizobium sp.]
MNYIAALLVNYAIYGAWKDPASLGWPASIAFPPAATVPSLWGTRVHVGLIVGVIAALILHVGVTYTRWGIALKVLSGNRKVGAMAGFSFVRQTLLVMGSVAPSPVSPASVKPRRFKAGCKPAFPSDMA